MEVRSDDSRVSRPRGDDGLHGPLPHTEHTENVDRLPRENVAPPQLVQPSVVAERGCFLFKYIDGEVMWSGDGFKAQFHWILLS